MDKTIIFGVLGSILKFRLEEGAQEHVNKILQFYTSTDSSVKNLTRVYLLRIFNDSIIVNHILESLFNKYDKNTKAKNIDGKICLGYEVYKSLYPRQHGPYRESFYSLDKYDNYQFKKFYKQCQRALKSLQKFNKKYK